ncbi:hypothetical protein MUU72_31265 [Streptomyces sp. RS10V-4]|uniref:hypothetical protein n=1 Tax=Streptomyces rhizoryzae TaxID=2932493 RepID=UPI0020045D0A|nr:hypothetical protein [Streptomyces rhizoryzae]MCK7627522.1 hypothetical protein [Streptomyces rhizoryzae]
MPGLSGPVHLPDPFPEPRPVPGCDVCAALVRQREAHRRHRAYALAASCTLELERHFHRGKANP